MSCDAVMSSSWLSGELRSICSSSSLLYLSAPCDRQKAVGVKHWRHYQHHCSFVFLLRACLFEFLVERDKLFTCLGSPGTTSKIRVLLDFGELALHLSIPQGTV